MSGYLKAKLRLLAGLAIIFGLMWFIEDFLQLGLLDLFEYIFGRGLGVVLYLFFLIFLASVLVQVGKNLAKPRPYTIDKDRKIIGLIQEWQPFRWNTPEQIKSEFLDPAGNVFVALLQNACNVSFSKASLYDKAASDSMAYLIDGALCLGYEYKAKVKADPKTIPDEVRADLVLVCQPAYTVASALIDISHSPGRIILLPENPDALKLQMRQMFLKVAGVTFLFGASSL